MATLQLLCAVRIACALVHLMRFQSIRVADTANGCRKSKVIEAIAKQIRLRHRQPQKLPEIDAQDNRDWELQARSIARKAM